MISAGQLAETSRSDGHVQRAIGKQQALFHFHPPSPPLTAGSTIYLHSLTATTIQAANAWGRIKKKLAQRVASANDGDNDDDGSAAAASSTPKSKATTGKKRGRKPASAADDHHDDDDEDAKPPLKVGFFEARYHLILYCVCENGTDDDDCRNRELRKQRAVLPRLLLLRMRWTTVPKLSRLRRLRMVMRTRRMVA